MNLKAKSDLNSTRLKRFRSFLCLNERSLKAHLHERICKVNFFSIGCVVSEMANLISVQHNEHLLFFRSQVSYRYLTATDSR